MSIEARKLLIKTGCFSRRGVKFFACAHIFLMTSCGYFQSNDENVSLDKLLKNPAQYHDRKIIVSGVLAIKKRELIVTSFGENGSNQDKKALRNYILIEDDNLNLEKGVFSFINLSPSQNQDCLGLITEVKGILYVGELGRMDMEVSTASC